MKSFLRAAKRHVLRQAQILSRPAHVVRGRLNFILPFPQRFVGAYDSYDAAVAAQRPGRLVGYNHPEVAPVSYELMTQMTLWDYPIVFWLERLLPDAKVLIDAGGHFGTKYRAFSRLLTPGPQLTWLVYDVPEIVRAGAARAEQDGLPITFEHQVARLPAADVFLASGLLQYLPEPLSGLLRELPSLPPHLLLNKVALRQGETIVTMEGIGPSRVPYHIRNHSEFLADLTALGYGLVDEWEISALAHVISTHPELGASKSAGFYFRLGR